MGGQKETEQQGAASFDTRSERRLEMHHRTRDLLKRYNASASDAPQNRKSILDDLLGQCGPGVWIEPPFYCDYGKNIRLGAGVFLNFNCVILDGDTVEIGEGTLLGPAVQIYATTHPISAEQRMFERDGVPGYRTQSEPISIGKNVWVGGGSIILPGVSVGEGTTIGAGSVVTKSIPANVFAAGNPCRTIRAL